MRRELERRLARLEAVESIRRKGKRCRLAADQFAGGHPVAAAAGLKTLEILESRDVYERIDRLGEKLYTALQEVADDVGVPVNVQHVGSMGQVYMTDEPIRRYRDTWAANGDQFADWWLEAAAVGVLFGNPMQSERFFTTYSHTDDQIDRAIAIAEDAFRKVDHDYR